jgi:hypothetical protein
MSSPFLATITLLGGSGGAQPKSSTTHLALITPVGGGHVDAGGPGWQGGPVDPGYGIGEGGRPGQDLPWGPGHPSGGFPISPGHPSGGFPVDPARPDNSLPPGGTPVPPEISNGLPPPGGDLGNQVVVAIYVPGKGWTGKSFPMAQPKPSQVV